LSARHLARLGARPDFDDGQLTRALSISAGTAVSPQDGESYDTLLDTADNRIYGDKRAYKAASKTEPA
jgi:GGDEF domain-containing protein